MSPTGPIPPGLGSGAWTKRVEAGVLTTGRAPDAPGPGRASRENPDPSPGRRGKGNGTQPMLLFARFAIMRAAAERKLS